MTGDLDLVVRDVLEQQVPLRQQARTDWEDVLRRAGVVSKAGNGRVQPRPARPRRASRLLLLAAALVIFAALATAASPLGPAVAGLGRDTFDGLSSWLRGEPGKPAPAAERAGFSERNASSYASFPSDTELRLLVRQRVGGKTFSLLGFRSGSSLCLRLVRSDNPAGAGTNQCVTLRELRGSPAPALVAAQAWFHFGNPGKNVEGIFGFADDTVRAIEARRAQSGWTRIPVSSNVFLSLETRPGGTVKNPPRYDPIVQVRALGKDAQRVRVPYVAGDSGDYARGIPGLPSYLKSPSTRLRDLPGPVRTDARFPGGTIGWLERREPRGEPYSPDGRAVGTIGSVVYARKLQPDPDSAVRVGAMLVRIGPGARIANSKPGELVICESELRPLGRGTSFGCIGPGADTPFPAGQPLILGGMGPDQLTQLVGLTADGVSAIDLYLASGRIVPAALRDNAYVVQVPTIQLPGKLIAYDDRHRVIGIQPIGGALKPAPCPPAVLAPASSVSRAPARYERLDLASTHVNGQPIFGRTVREVESALGRPDRIAYFSATNGVREPTLFYGGTRPESAALTVGFRYRKGRMWAISLNYQGQGVRDARLGLVLRMQPLELQRRIAATYAREYNLGLAYGSQPGRGCTGSFENEPKTVQITFGVNPYLGSRPSLVLWHGY